MGVTYTKAAERHVQRPRRRVGGFDLADLSLAVTSGVAILAITLAYVGRLSVFEESADTRARVQPVNLNTVVDAGQLEPAMGTVFGNVNDRRFASQELFRFLVDQRSQGRALPNVGAIARVTVNAGAIDRSRKLDDFTQRLQLVSQKAANAGRAPPEVIPLFTPADLATVKPLVSVRTRQDFRRQVLLFGGLYILGFHLVALVWRLRGIRSDPFLIAIAHLLTAIGFAVLLSRPDPLRDSLLFVRFAEGTVLGLVLMTGLSLIDFSKAGFVELSYLPLAGALSLSALLILF